MAVGCPGRFPQLRHMTTFLSVDRSEDVDDGEDDGFSLRMPGFSAGLGLRALGAAADRFLSILDFTIEFALAPVPVAGV